MSQIGMLCWMVQPRRVDVITEVSMLASQLACPRDGHLEVAHCIFACLDDKHDSCMVFDPTCASIDMGSFKECEGWREFCGNVSKAALKPMARRLRFILCVDSDHAGDQLIRRLRHFAFLNLGPLIWFLSDNRLWRLQCLVPGSSP
jgi:hypothetical protein